MRVFNTIISKPVWRWFAYVTSWLCQLISWTISFTASFFFIWGKWYFVIHLWMYHNYTNVAQWKNIINYYSVYSFYKSATNFWFHAVFEKPDISFKLLDSANYSPEQRAIWCMKWHDMRCHVTINILVVRA